MDIMKIKKAIKDIENFKYTCQYRGSCGACEACYSAIPMAVNALQKQVPVKPVYSDYDDNGYGEIIPNEAKCPVCGYEFEFGTWNDEDSHHCVCGQKMDWE